MKAEEISPERLEWLKKLADMKYCSSNPGHWLMSLAETNYLANLALQYFESNLALEKAQQGNTAGAAGMAESYETTVSMLKHRIAELENDEVRQRLANAEHQLHMAELAKHNLKASRKAQFRKRKVAERRIAELEESHAQVIQSRDHYKRMSEEGLKQIQESRTVTVKLPPRVDSSNVPFTAHTWNCCLDAVGKCLTTAGIQIIEGEGQ